MTTDFFTTIVGIANERVVTAKDFKEFTGRENWLSFGKSEPLGDVSGYPDAHFLSGIVWKFRLLGAYTQKRVPVGYGRQHGLKQGMVMIALIDEHNGEHLMAMDADELAIRMDES